MIKKTVILLTLLNINFLERMSIFLVILYQLRKLKKNAKKLK